MQAVRYFFFSILFLFLMQATAQNDSLIEKVFFYGDGSLSSQGYFINGQPEGYWRTYYPNQNLKSEGNRKLSVLDGKWIFYSENQDTTEIIQYRNAIKNGWNIKFDSNKVKSKTLYLNSKIIGLSYEYFKNSYIEIPHKNALRHGLAFEYQDDIIINIIEFKNGFKLSTKAINRKNYSGLKKGSWIQFFANRRIHFESNFKNDTLHGYFREYDIQGNLLKNILYENGTRVQTDSNLISSKILQSFYANGNLKSEGYFTFGVPVGLHKELDQEGKLFTGLLYNSEGELIGKGLLDKDGKKTGKWFFYNSNQDIISEGFYKKNRRVKEWIFYHEKGGIEQQGKYKNGKLNGKWHQYFANSALFKTENYKKGKLEGEFIQNKPSGELFIQGWYSDNLLDKEWIYNYDNIVKYEYYDRGQRQGPWQSKYLNGKLAFKGNYVDNEPNGKHIYYYTNGQVKELQYYIYGSREKYWTKYDAFEGLTFSYQYKNDKLIKINGYKYKLAE